jgi:hypothetical protein
MRFQYEIGSIACAVRWTLLDAMSDAISAYARETETLSAVANSQNRQAMEHATAACKSTADARRCSNARLQ